MTDSFIGIEAFDEVTQGFHTFAHLEDIATHACKNFICGAMHPQMNYVYHLSTLNLDKLKTDIETLESTRIPMLCIVAEQESKSVEALFKEKNIRFIGTAQTKSFDLSTFHYRAHQTLRIELVDEPDELKIWRDLAAEAFGYPLDTDDLLFSDYLKAGHHQTVQLLIAYEDEIPVGQCMLVLGKTMAINMWSSVLPEYRRRGYLTEMIQYRMHLAKEAGYQNMVVQCMPMSRVPYDRLGYQNKEMLNIYVLNADKTVMNNF